MTVSIGNLLAADHEIKMGKYYAGIYIPSKFTHQVTGTLRKHPQKADVNFKVNQKLMP